MEATYTATVQEALHDQPVPGHASSVAPMAVGDGTLTSGQMLLW